MQSQGEGDGKVACMDKAPHSSPGRDDPRPEPAKRCIKKNYKLPRSALQGACSHLSIHLPDTNLYVIPLHRAADDKIRCRARPRHYRFLSCSGQGLIGSGTEGEAEEGGD